MEVQYYAIFLACQWAITEGKSTVPPPSTTEGPAYETFFWANLISAIVIWFVIIFGCTACCRKCCKEFCSSTARNACLLYCSCCEDSRVCATCYDRCTATSESDNPDDIDNPAFHASESDIFSLGLAEDPPPYQLALTMPKPQKHDHFEECDVANLQHLDLNIQQAGVSHSEMPSSAEENNTALDGITTGTLGNEDTDSGNSSDSNNALENTQTQITVEVLNDNESFELPSYELALQMLATSES